MGNGKGGGGDDEAMTSSIQMWGKQCDDDVWDGRGIHRLLVIAGREKKRKSIHTA